MKKNIALGKLEAKRLLLSFQGLWPPTFLLSDSFISEFQGPAVKNKKKRARVPEAAVI